MNWKLFLKFLKPDWRKVIVFIVLGIIIVFAWSLMAGYARVPPSSFSLIARFIISLEKSLLVAILVIYIISCLFVFLYEKSKKQWRKGIAIKALIAGVTLILIGSICFGFYKDIKIIEKYTGPSKDTRIMADMSQIRTKAELINAEEGSYVPLSCNYDEEMRKLCDDIEFYAGSKPTVHSTNDKYCAYVKLTTHFKGIDNYYCIDSTGFANRVTMNPGQENYCDGTTFVCQKKEVEDETANWKTYRNEGYGFEVKYPEEGKTNYEEKENGYFRVSFSLPTVSYSWETERERHDLNKYFQITIRDLPAGEFRCGMYNIRKEGKIQVDDIKFQKMSGEAGGMSVWNLLSCYSTKKRDKRFELIGQLEYVKHRVVPGRDFDQEEEVKVFDQMLSTFRFLE